MTEHFEFLKKDWRFFKSFGPGSTSQKRCLFVSAGLPLQTVVNLLDENGDDLDDQLFFRDEEKRRGKASTPVKSAR